MKKILYVVTPHLPNRLKRPRKKIANLKSETDQEDDEEDSHKNIFKKRKRKRLRNRIIISNEDEDEDDSMELKLPGTGKCLTNTLDSDELLKRKRRAM